MKIAIIAVAEYHQVNKGFNGIPILPKVVLTKFIWNERAANISDDNGNVFSLLGDAPKVNTLQSALSLLREEFGGFGTMTQIKVMAEMEV